MGQFSIIFQVRILVHNNQDFIEHHLAGSPHGIHHFLRMSGKFLFDLGNDQVMKNSFHRHIHIDDFRQQGHFDGSEEDPFGCLPQPGILLGRNTHNGSRVNSITAVRNTGDVEARIPVREGVVACMVSEWPFPDQFFIRINIAFNDKIRIPRYFNIWLAETTDQFHFSFA